MSTHYRNVIVFDDGTELEVETYSKFPDGSITLYPGKAASEYAPRDAIYVSPIGWKRLYHTLRK